MESVAILTDECLPRERTAIHDCHRRLTVAAMKARQSAKIREISEALKAAGFVTLDAQARALGLARSTTWAVLQNGYKHSGISGSVISRILTSPQLPSTVAAKVGEYVEEKLGGLYGHSQLQRRRFIARL